MLAHYEFSLYWSTDAGNDWLQENFSVTTDAIGLKTMIDEYHASTVQSADRLVNGWQRNGEDVSLFLSCHAADQSLLKLLCDIIDKRFP